MCGCQNKNAALNGFFPETTEANKAVLMSIAAVVYITGYFIGKYNGKKSGKKK